MKLRINFSRRAGRISALAFFLLACSLAIVGDAAWQCYEAAKQLRSLETTLAGTRMKAKNAVPRLASSEIAAINRAVLQLNLPWAQLITAIEENLSDDLALLALEPDAGKQLLRVQGEAKSAEAMIEFMDDLSAEELFLAVTLVRHEINDRDRNKPYRFTLEAKWR